MTTSTEAAVDAMETYARINEHATMVELQREAAKHIDAEGNEAWVLAEDQNIVLWFGVSDEFLEAVKTMLKRGRLDVKPAHPLCYLIDGGMPKLPLVKRPPKNGYKDPHWLPITLTPKAGHRATNEEVKEAWIKHIEELQGN